MDIVCSSCIPCQHRTGIALSATVGLVHRRVSPTQAAPPTPARPSGTPQPATQVCSCYNTTMTEPAPRCVNPSCSKPLQPDKRRPGQYKVRRGWCEACYSRWQRNGHPETWPHVPAPKIPVGTSQGWPEAARLAAHEARKRKNKERCEDALWLLESGTSLEEATTRAKISEKTLRRYLVSIGI